MNTKLPDDISLRQIVLQAMTGLLQTGVDGTIQFANPRFCQWLGYELAELQGRSVLDITHPQDREVTKGKLATILRVDDALTYDKRYLRKDGSVLPVTVSKGPLLDERGRRVGLIATVLDRTRQAETERVLSASEERLTNALEVGAMNAWDWDMRTNAVSCSANAVAFWGRDVGSADDFLRVVHPEDLPRLSEATARAVQDEGVFEETYRLLTPAGLERWVTSVARVVRDEGGRACRLHGLTMDVTKRKKAEDAAAMLAEAGSILGSSLDYQTTLNQLSRVIVPRLADWYAIDLLDDDGRLQRVSVAHADPAKVRLALELQERYPPKRDVAGGAWKAIDTGKPDWAPDIPDALLVLGAYDDEHLRLLRGLSLRSYICAPLVGRGKTIGVLTVVHAESGRRYVEEDVRLIEDIARRAGTAVENARMYAQLQMADRRKDEFLAMLAHELRNPLAPITTAATLIQTVEGDSRVQRAAQIIGRQVAHMSELIDDLLDVSRVTRGLVRLDMAEVDLKAVVAGAVEQVQPLIDRRGHTLSTWMGSDAMITCGDRARLVQIVSNLLNNSAKYTPPGGTIAVRVEGDVQWLSVLVKDNGVGIDRQLLPQVFELFTQAERTPDRTQGGLGIGLALVRSLARMHGGDISAQSEGLGHGSTFILRLPRIAPPGVQVSASPEEEVLPSGGRRVLVVDDNLDAAEALAEVLRLHGHAVQTTPSSQAALNLSRDKPPDVYILDIGLPDIDGLQLVQALRALPTTATARYIALTGYGQPEDRRRALEAGFHEHMVKPADIPRLLRLMEPPGA